MIQASIRQEHIEAAMAEIDREGVPAKRQSRKFVVLRNEKYYPPKYLISIASRIAERELKPEEFNGGTESNEFLRKRGYTVTSCDGDPASVGLNRRAAVPQTEGTIPPDQPLLKMPSKRRRSTAIITTSHDERCKDCKQRVEQFLTTLYGAVDKNASIKIPATPEDLKQSPAWDKLQEIYGALQQRRGFSSFVGSATLPPCDFVVPNPRFIVEFDESQHFTPLRKLTLTLYPSELHLGFDIEEWMRLCDRLQQRDNNPAFRDEQRAWYDTLRDFAPSIETLMPTIRLYAREFEWCKLDVDTFRQRLGEWLSSWRLEFRIPEQSKLARLVIDGSWLGNGAAARKLLADICDNWPANLHVKCVSTPGAFLTFKWPESIPSQVNNKFPGDDAICQIDTVARQHVQKLLSDGLRQRLAKFSDYLTIGIDTGKPKISSTNNHIGIDHAELVYVVELGSGTLYFTGKSYPTPNQEDGLLRVTDLESHFVGMSGEQAMVLGCHDLTIFNPRSDAVAQGWRKKTKEEFKDIASHKAPVLVLHHPHTTVKRMTWRHAWEKLISSLPSVRSYLGTGCYSFRDKNGLDRDLLGDVLDATKSSDTVDIIVAMGAGPSSAQTGPRS